MVGANISEQAIKCFILDNQSITTIMFIQPLFTRNSIIKSIKMSFYLWSKINNSFKKPLYVLYKALTH